MPQRNVVVLLGSRWAPLQDQATRWREVVIRWVRSHPELTVTLIDWPRYSIRAALPGAAPLIVDRDSWLEGTRLLDATVPLLRTPTPVDRRGWGRVARAVRDRVGGGALDLAVSANPLWNPLLGQLGAARTAFDAVDDWRGHPVSKRLAARIREGYRAARSIDVVTANSAALGERLRADFGLEAIVEPNGVDVAALRARGPRPLGLPERPFAIYVGVVQERVDIALLVETAKRAEVPVVVAGPAEPHVADTLRAAGVHLLGAIPHDEVPALLGAAAVGLLPHRVNPFTTSMDPMKLLEYLAAGLPVVSSRLPGVDELSDRVVVTDTAGQFAAAVTEAAARGRYPDPAPEVLDREWTGVAERLLELHAGAVR